MGGSDTFAINVPFQLLNLTLDTSLSSSTLQYFPCQPLQDPNSQQYELSRAFLQAAFVGVNWGDGQKQCSDAQAPEPHISSVTDYRPIENGEPPAGSGDSWVGTWNSSWTHLTATNSNRPSVPTQTPPPNKIGISGGATAGIAVGAVVVVLIGIALGIFVWRRKTSTSQSQTALMNEQEKREEVQEKKEEVQAPGMEVPPQYLTAEMPGTVRLSELHNSQLLSEISINEIGLHEMSTLSSLALHPSDI